MAIRIVVPLPGRSVIWSRPGQGALVNAREAMATIAAALADRLVLTEALVGDEGPGDLHALTRQECYDLLQGGSVGRFAYVAREGVPDIVPVNYLIDGDDVLIRSGPGPKLQAAERHDVVAFEMDRVDEVTHTGASVVVVGRASRLRGTEQERLAEKVLPWANGPRSHVIRIRPTRVTGRRLG